MKTKFTKLNDEDRAEALRRFVPWDHVGILPADEELLTKLAAAREAEAAELERLRDLEPERMLARIKDLETRLAALPAA